MIIDFIRGQEQQGRTVESVCRVLSGQGLQVAARSYRAAKAGRALSAQLLALAYLILGAGVLPSAGDVRGVIMGDVVGAYVVGLPLAVILGLHTPLGFVGVFVARVVEELVKVLIFSRRTRRVRWSDLFDSSPPDRSRPPAAAPEAEELAELA
jgi:hypothetical protein